jgi:hypothetical protein
MRNILINEGLKEDLNIKTLKELKYSAIKKQQRKYGTLMMDEQKRIKYASKQ